MPSKHSTTITMMSSSNDLLTELQSHNVYFDTLVNLIPAKLYVAGASGDDLYNPKYLHGQHKESKEARRARNKLNVEKKFHPEKRESTLDVKRRVKLEMEEIDDVNDDINDIVMSDGDGEEEIDIASPPEKDDSTKGFSSRIEMLRAKLHAKMAEKRAAAGIAVDHTAADGGVATTNIDTSSPALVSKRAARRAEKRKRQEAAKQRNKKKLNSVAEGKSSQQQERVVKNLGGSTYNAPSAKSNNKSTSTTTSAAEDLATIDYQSLAGLKGQDGALDNKSLLAQGIGKGSNKGKNKKKSLEKLLADAERKQARLKELKASGIDEDREKAQNIEWGEAMKVAGGANTKKEDPKLLKKALKRKAKKKAASAKAWNVRVEQVQDSKSKKQQIRTHNLDSRKMGGAVGANLSSKRIVEQDDKEEGGKKEKRRRLGPHSNRAGFEGKKSGFINGSDGGGASGATSGKKGVK